MLDLLNARAVIIKADGNARPYYPEEAGRLSLKEMKDIVGGHIQIVGDYRFDMAVDEEGKLKGKPCNHAATVIARKLGMIDRNDTIVGDVIICPKGFID